MGYDKTCRILIILLFVALGFLTLRISEVSAVTAGQKHTQESVKNAVSRIGAPQRYADGIITNFDSRVTLETNGTATITEKIIVYFPFEKHGIYRWIPNTVILDNGKKLRQPIKVDSVTYRKLPNQSGELQGDTTQAYSTSNSKGGYTVLKIGEAETVIQGAYEYTIIYSMKRAVRYQDGFQELYLNITGDKWEIPIISASALISSPKPATDTKCYTGASGSAESRCNTATQSNDTFFSTSTPTSEMAQGLTVALKYPDGTFTPPSDFEKLVDQILFLLPYFSLLIPTMVGLYVFNTWRKHGKDLPLNAIPPQFVVSKELKEGSLSSYSALLAMNKKPLATLAELIKIAEQNLLTIDFTKGKVTLKISDEQRPKLQEYLNKGPASLKDMIEILTRNYSSESALHTLKNVDTSIQRINTEAGREFESLPYTTDQSEGLQKQFYVFGGFSAAGAVIALAIIGENSIEGIGPFLLPISLGISAFLFFLFGAKMLKRTKEGERVTRELLGLKKYIKTAELKRLDFFNDPQKMIAHYEDLLPFAIIFGLDKKWSAAFGPILEQLLYSPSWLVSDVPISHALPRTYASLATNFASAMTKISTPPHSGGSSFSGGGGFSGGGSGGGGGGSW